jgi:hypothetical protein
MYSGGAEMRAIRRSPLLSRVESYNHALLALLQYLQSKYGTQFLNRGRLNQDILENLFSHVGVYEGSYGHLLLTALNPHIVFESKC